jgi:hypothetical protein
MFITVIKFHWFNIPPKFHSKSSNVHPTIPNASPNIVDTFAAETKSQRINGNKSTGIEELKTTTVPPSFVKLDLKFYEAVNTCTRLNAQLSNSHMSARDPGKQNSGQENDRQVWWVKPATSR